MEDRRLGENRFVPPTKVGAVSRAPPREGAEGVLPSAAGPEDKRTRRTGRLRCGPVPPRRAEGHSVRPCERRTACDGGR